MAIVSDLEVGKKRPQGPSRHSNTSYSSTPIAKDVKTTANDTTEPETPPVYTPDVVQPGGNEGIGGGGSGSGGSGNGGAATATYIDADGNRQTGQVEPVEGQPSYWDTMREYYQQMYDEQVGANNASAEAAQARAREAADAQLAALAEGYRGTNRQLYRDYMQNQQKLPQQMAAMGYNGGMSESSQLRLRNAYEEALADNERARLSEEAKANQNYAQQAYETQAAATAANNQAAQNRLSYLAALQEQQRAQERADLENRAAMLGAAGDYSAYAGLGYSQDEIDYLERLWQLQHPGLYASLYGGGGSGGSGYSGGDGGNPEAYTDEKLKKEVSAAVAGGASYADTLDAIATQYNSGAITYSQAQAAMAQASREVYNRNGAGAAVEAAMAQAQAQNQVGASSGNRQTFWDTLRNMVSSPASMRQH